MIILDYKYKKNFFYKNNYNVLDTYLNNYIEPIKGNENYYLFHNGNNNDRYKRVIDLNCLDIVITEKEDNLENYGFKLVYIYIDGAKKWKKMEKYLF